MTTDTGMRTSIASPTPASARDIRRWIAGLRARSARHGWGGDDVYVVVLSALFAAAAAVASVRAVAQLGGDAGGADVALLAATGLACGAALLWAAATAGPLGLAAPTLMWVATGPVSRRSLLLPRLVVVLLLGAATGLLPALLVAPASTTVPAIAVVLVCGAAAGTAVTAAAACVQTIAREPASVLRAAAAITGAAALAVAAARTWADLGRSRLVPDPPVAVAAVLAAVAAVAVVGAVLRLDRLRLEVLYSTAASTAAVTGGIVTADPGLLVRVAEARRWRHSRLRGRLSAATGARALAAHDVLALVRLPGRLWLVAALVVAPALLADVSTRPTVLLGGWLGAAMLAAGQATGNVRHETDRVTLVRLLGLTERRLVAHRAVVPSVVAALWAAATTGLLAARTGGDPIVGLALGAAAGPAIAAGALRAARRSLVRHDYPLIVTPMGVAPSGPMLWAVQGLDLAVIGTVPLLVALAANRFVWLTVLLQAVLSGAVLTAYLMMIGRRTRPTAGLRALLQRVVTVVWRL
ncbi:DUF6297 family protein [Micromonospora sp. DT201]|uniref:DUF6297 family protein n=1 Tax=Micromonospora sp. DT201 TaxID=3393442 RepID=UPI003CEA1278